MEIIFSFDTEDYVDPRSNDALKALAEIHSRHRIPACFGLVGEKARFLGRLGRKDVIDAVCQHDVAYHSDHHFMFADNRYDPPLTPEYMEVKDWDTAVARLIEEESRGIHDVGDIFGVRPRTWLRTYGDWAPQYLAAFERLGIAVYAYGPPFHVTDPAPIWYCNQLVVANPRMSYESNLHDTSMSAEAKLEVQKKTLLSHLEQGTERIGVVTHPTRFISPIWWEQPNWWDGIIPPPPRGQWTIPPRFSDRQTGEMLWIVDEFVKFVSDISDITPVTFEDFRQKYATRPRWVTRTQARDLAESMGDAVTYVCLENASFSPAELFGIFTIALAEPEQEQIPVRPLLGPTDEFIAKPETGKLSVPALRADCQLLELILQDMHRVPAVIRTGIGPVNAGTMLLAMARALASSEETDVCITTAPNLPVPLHEKDYDALVSRAPAAFIQKRGCFDFPKTQRWGQQQYWTVKPAVAGAGEWVCGYVGE